MGEMEIIIPYSGYKMTGVLALSAVEEEMVFSFVMGSVPAKVQ